MDVRQMGSTGSIFELRDLMGGMDAEREGEGKRKREITSEHIDTQREILCVT